MHLIQEELIVIAAVTGGLFGVAIAGLWAIEGKLNRILDELRRL